MDMDVFIVQHVHVLEDEEEDVKLIGVYSTRTAAEAAIQRLTLRPGFCDSPEGFSIDLYRVDQDSWEEGFVTLRGRQGSNRADPNQG